MNALREIVSPKNGRLSIKIPKEYTQERFEVIVIPIEEKNINETIQRQMEKLLKLLPSQEPNISLEDIVSEIKTIRTERYE
jgi:hypothetical protein